MTAIDTWIADLEANKISLNDQPLVSQVDVAVAAIQELQAGGTPATANANTVFAGPVSGVAAAPTFRALVSADFTTTLQPNINRVGVGGNATFQAGISGGPVNLNLVAGGSSQFFLSTTILGAVAGTCALSTAAASNVQPVFIPRQGAATTGIGSQGANNISFIAVGAEIERTTAAGQQTILQYTFATLPAAAAGNQGVRTFITDGAALPVFGAAAAGAGTLLTPVYSDGATWRNG